MPPPVTDWKQEEFLCVRHDIPGGSTSSCGHFKEANNGPTVCPQVTKAKLYHPGVSGCLQCCVVFNCLHARPQPPQWTAP